MEHVIHEMREKTWCVDEGGVRFFVLEGTEKAIMIDSGMNSPEAKSIGESLTDKPLMLLCTHADRDHISGNDAFDQVMMHPSEFAFYRHSGKHTQKLLAAREGDMIDLGNRELEIIALPGHTPGSIGILDRKERVLISGDPIQKGGHIYMFGPQRDMEAYLDSLNHLKKWNGAYDEIWPSHGEIPVAPDMVEELAQKAAKVLAGEMPCEDAEMHGSPISTCDVGGNVFLLDRTPEEK